MSNPVTPQAPAQGDPPPAGNDDFYHVMERLSENARLVRSAHFIAAQRKGRTQKIFGVAVVILNVLIGSGLIEAYSRNPGQSALVIKTLAFLAASLAGIQTFFNFQKEVECHTTAGGVYSSINHRLDPVLAEYKTNPATRAQTIEAFKKLNDEYLKANDDARQCIPTDRNFDDARKGMKKRRGH
jgi:hypothetical protein